VVPLTAQRITRASGHDCALIGAPRERVLHLAELAER
jgi:hypothetical protein